MSEIPEDLKFPRLYRIIRSKNIVADSKYSSIYITIYQKRNKKYRITKYCAAKLIKEEGGITEDQEYYITKHLNHPNVLKPLGLYKSQVTIIFYPWMSGGNLREWIDKRIYHTEKDVRLLFKQMVEGVKYIHSKGIIHQDIKLDNFLITNYGHVKLSDFGLAMYHPKKGMINNNCGSPVYMAPEILLGGKHTYSADIWSLGICLYEMIYGKTPFDHLKNIEELELEIQKPIKYNKVNSEILDLLIRMLSFYLNSRISINDIRCHCWFKSTSNTLIGGLQQTKKYKTL